MLLPIRRLKRKAIMSSISSGTIRRAGTCVTLGLLAVSGLALAQDEQNQPAPPPDRQYQEAPSTGGFKRAGDSAASTAAYPNDPPPNSTSNNGQTSNGPVWSEQTPDGNGPQGPPPPPRGGWQNPVPRPPQGRWNSSAGPNQPNYDPARDQQNYEVPAQLTLRPGTYVMVRVNQPISSDRNRAGDGFSATLARPIVIDGVVVAEPGQTVGGRVAEAQKAGRVEGVSRLALQLTDLTLVDGQQIPVQSQLVQGSGGTSVGRDVGAVAGTTGLGAAIGAAAGWGTGAAIGAGAGAAVGLVGVLLTRGHATVVYPETLLTFRVEAPVTISTARSPQVFRYVNPDDYNNPSLSYAGPADGEPGPPRTSLCGPYGCPGAYSYPYPYYGLGYYPYWGSGFSFYYGPTFYRGGFYRGGYYRGGYIRGGGYAHGSVGRGHR